MIYKIRINQFKKSNKIKKLKIVDNNLWNCKDGMISDKEEKWLSKSIFFWNVKKYLLSHGLKTIKDLRF